VKNAEPRQQREIYSCRKACDERFADGRAVDTVPVI